MIYRMKIRIKKPGGPALPSTTREELVALIERGGGKDATGPNPRAHIVGVFPDNAAAKEFREQARLVLKLVA